MKKVALVTTAAVTVLAACSQPTSQSSEEFIQMNPLKEMSKRELEKCTAWAEYDDISQEETKYPGVLFCTTASTPIYMYKGIFTETAYDLISSEFYKSGGEVTTGIERLDILIPAYSDGKYTTVLNVDESSKYPPNLTEDEAEGVLATSEELDATEWTADENDSEVLVADSGGHAMYMGVLFPTLMALQMSNFYNSQGSDRSAIAVPASYRNGSAALAYSAGSYKPSNSASIKGSSVRVSSTPPTTVKGTSAAGRSGFSSGARGGGGS